MCRWISEQQQKSDHRGGRNICAACGHPGTKTNPLDLDDEGFRVHANHLDNPKSGLYGHRQR